MVLDFSITNFRSIRETQTISFEADNSTHLEDYYVVKKDKYRILKVATILGANASGKSNILLAFKAMRDLILKPCENKTDIIPTDTFALDPECQSRNTAFVLNFLCVEQKYHYEVEFNSQTIEREVLTRQPFGEKKSHVVFERTTDKDTKVASLKMGSKYKAVTAVRGLGVNLLHNRTVFGAFQKSNVNLPWMSEILDWASSYFMPNITTSNQNIMNYVSKLIADNVIGKESVAQLLHTADFGINDFLLERTEEQLQKGSIELVVRNNGTTRISDNTYMAEGYKVNLIHHGAKIDLPFDYDQESHGTQRYYELSGILLMLIKEPHFAAIDELECRLHPDLYLHFIETFLNNARESQIVFTTHMREFLEDKDFYRDDTVWFAEKSETGVTDLYSLTDFGSDILRGSASRYNAYRHGRLGARPNLHAYYHFSITTSNSDR